MYGSLIYVEIIFDFYFIVDNVIFIKLWFVDLLDIVLLNLLFMLDVFRFVFDVRFIFSRNLYFYLSW